MKEEEISQKSKREIVLERLKGRYPDLNLDDDEALYDSIDQDYSRHEALMNKDKELTNMFTENPRFATFFLDVFNGGDVLSKFIEHFGQEALEASNDPEKMEKILEADKAFREKKSKSEEIALEQQANMENSVPVIDAFKEEKGLSDEEVNQLLNDICNDSAAIFMGIYSPEVLEAKWKSTHFDDSMAQALQEGEVKGKNARIGELKMRNAVPEGLPPTLTSKATLSKEITENPTLAALRRLGK